MEHHNCIAEAIKVIPWNNLFLCSFLSILSYSLCKAIGGGWEKK